MQPDPSLDLRVAIFCHSLESDWNHGNAHFLRGIVVELIARGAAVTIYEPEDGWSRRNLIASQGIEPVEEFRRAFPYLKSNLYDPETLDLEQALTGADVVLVHEWNSPELVEQIGAYRRGHKHLRALFHDTHHRSVTAPEEMSRYDLSNYDGVLAFGKVIRDLYLERKWARRAWVWQEAADIRIFHPLPGTEVQGDLVWIGNWGDDERTAELEEFLFQPARELKLRTSVYGVRYPEEAVQKLKKYGIDYRGWLPNYRAPRAYAAHRVTVHVPRRPYVEALPGVPTIRPFEALACGIALISAPWNDTENLFTAEEDFLMVSNGKEMTQALDRLLKDDAERKKLAERGRQTVLERHTCAHRVEELLSILRDLDVPGAKTAPGEDHP